MPCAGRIPLFVVVSFRLFYLPCIFFVQCWWESSLCWSWESNSRQKNALVSQASALTARPRRPPSISNLICSTPFKNFWLLLLHLLSLQGWPTIVQIALNDKSCTKQKFRQFYLRRSRNISLKTIIIWFSNLILKCFQFWAGQPIRINIEFYYAYTNTKVECAELW